MSGIFNMKKNSGKTRSELSREWMCTALVQLMENKPFSRISITEITKKAGVSRITFYRHYTNKEDIFIKKLDDLFEVFNTLTQSLWESPNFIYHGFVVVFQFVAENENMIINMIDAGISHLIIDKFKEFVMEMFIIDNNDDHYYAHYLAGGIYATVIEWINRKHDRSPEEMAAFFENGPGSNQVLKRKVRSPQ